MTFKKKESKPAMNLTMTKLLTFGVLLLFVACGSSDKQEEIKPEPNVEAQTVAVGLTAVQPEPVAIAVDVTGTTEAVRAANVAPQISARVQKVLVSEGEEVKAGQGLVHLDASDARLRASQAKSQAASSEVQAQQLASDYERLAPLATRGSIAPQRVDQLEAQRDAMKAAASAAKAAADQASRDVSQALVRAPFAGTVSSVLVEAGEMANRTPATTLVRLVDLSEIEIRIRVHEQDLARVKVGAPATVTIESIGETFDAKVSYVRPEIDVRNRTAEVVVRLPNKDRKILAGMFARVRIEPKEPRNALVVPREAVISAGDDRFVYQVESGVARRKAVRVQPVDEQRVEVLSGLHAGAQIVSSDVSRVSEGARVEEKTVVATKETEQAAP